MSGLFFYSKFNGDVSNWDVSDYGIEARSDGDVHPNIAVLDAIYNQDLLNSNELVYDEKLRSALSTPVFV